MVILDNLFYPYLLDNKDRVIKFIKLEEEKFEKTLNAGETMLRSIVDTNISKLSGKDAFTLYDTYGFPFELTKEICSEYKIDVDEEGFKAEMEKQKIRAREARVKENSMHSQSEDLMNFTDASEFTYEPQDIKTKVIGIFKDGNKVDEINDNGQIILEKTNFYAESGGQVGDKGTIELASGLVSVEDTVKAPNKQHLHLVNTNGLTIKVGDEVITHIDQLARLNTQRNHSAVHLLQKALQETLGDHIKQAGSYVDDLRLRFDFNHYEKVTNEQLEEIENKVNLAINKALDNNISLMSKEEATKMGAMALFNEKYGDVVRVVNFGIYSIELCGGCHVKNTSDIGLFIITKEESISSGVRRIEGLTGINAYRYLKDKENTLNIINRKVGGNGHDVTSKVDSLLEEINNAKKQLADFKDSLLANEVNKLINDANNDKGYRCIISVLENADKNLNLKLVDTLKSRNDEYFVFIINKANDKLSLFAACSKLVNAKGMHCGQLISTTSKMALGGGGGSPVMASAGGKDVTKIDEIINYVKGVLV